MPLNPHPYVSTNIHACYSVGGLCEAAPIPMEQDAYISLFRRVFNPHPPNRILNK